MTQEKVDLFMMTNSKCFPPASLGVIRERLLAADESKLWALHSVDLKDPATIFLVSLFGGALGIDRFLLGDTAMGVLKLLTMGLCGILAFVDLFTISKKTKEKN